ncbi:MAG TPA: hypothetical protein DG761_00470 [Gammaproteobacteria bacterium]|nr:hypothetical protein [Gammaproteobacteria bacterium]
MATDQNDLEKMAYAAAWSLPLMMSPLPLVQQALDALEQMARAQLAALYNNMLGRLRSLSDSLWTGQISAAQFRAEMNSLIRQSYGSAATYGRYAAHDIQSPSAAETFSVAEQVRAELKYADNLVNQYENQEVSRSKFNARLDMYPGAVAEVFNRSWATHTETNVFRWRMSEGAQHCIACLEAAGGSGKDRPAGQYSLAELPFYPGRSPVCLDNCMCFLIADNGRRSAPAVRAPAGNVPSRVNTEG